MPEQDHTGRIKLTAQEKQDLESMGPELMNLEVEIKRARRAGLDVDELEESFRKAKNVRDGLLREYG